MIELEGTIGHIVTDYEMRVLTASTGYYNIYNVARDWRPQTLLEVIEDRLHRNFFSLSECLTGKLSPETRIREIASAARLSTFQVSNQGQIIMAQHNYNNAVDRFTFTYIDTQLELESDAQTSSLIEIFGQSLFTLLENSQFFSPICFDTVGMPSQKLEPVRLIADANGIIIASSNKEGRSLDVGDIKSLEELVIKHGQLFDDLREIGRSRVISNNELRTGAAELFVDAKQLSTHPNGPKFIVADVYPFSHEDIFPIVKQKFRELTEQEAVAVANLALGRPAKTISGVTNKSPVTIGIQLRNAMHKLGVNTLYGLQTRVLTACIP